ncbi:MAG: hypothetical protein J2P27_14475, partial [Actinobacteria bacterium]|nr:hypothetical protein [Actinomycetota bacterium]
GLTLGARYELREEMLTEAGVPFLIMTTSSFLIHAGQYLHVPVSPETVSQAKELPDAVTDDRTTALEAEYQARLDSLRRLRREIDYQIKSASDDVYRISDELDQISAKARDEQWSDEEFMLRMRGLRTRLSDSKEIVRRQMERKEEVDGMLASAERGLGFARLGELRLG